MVEKKLYGKLVDGRNVYQYSISNKWGTRVQIINYGAIVTNLILEDKHGIFKDVVLGYDDLPGYINDKFFMGSTVGRYGNRIANGRFVINGNKYQLNLNDGYNHLHGGFKGFNKVLWDVEEIGKASGDSIKLRYFSSDGEGGYPGNVEISVVYKLTDANELMIHYEAKTDKLTIINPTHHSYFNLSGDFSKTVLDHKLQIDAVGFTPINKDLIPTGVIERVRNTPMDFREMETIGLHINDEYEQLRFGNGYDHNWVLNNFNGQVRKVASLYDPSSGRYMELLTDQPGLQFYSGNSLDEKVKAKKRINFRARTGLCLEAQYFPDSPNNSSFPSTQLNPGETYEQNTIYKFSIKK